jgi:hypothetical protein
VLAVEARGILAGGDFRVSMYQVRQLFYLPPLVFLLAAALRGPEDHALLGGAMIAAALLKAAISVHAYLFVFLPAGARPAFITCHADSVLYATSIAALLAYWAERPNGRGRWTLLVAAALIAAGIWVNDRRVAWVELAGALVAIFPFLGSRSLKRSVARAAVLAAPVLALYLALGWSSDAPAFESVRSLRALVDGSTDRSTLYREVENYNLVFTLQQNPILGSGFGRPYLELARFADLTAIFPLWRYLPHNSILALLAFAGVVGFTLIWLPLVVAVFLAARSLAFTRAPIARAGALGAMASVVAYAIQGYGDMGLNSTECVLVVALGVALAGKLAPAVGAWPSAAHRVDLASGASGPEPWPVRGDPIDASTSGA